MLLTSYGKGSLLAPAAVAGAGGGGGGEAALTMEAVLAEVDKRIGANLSAGFDKFRKEGLSSAIDEKLAPITSSLTGITDAISKLTPAATTTPGNTSQQVPPEVNVQLKQLLETTKQQGTMIESLKKQKEEADTRAERSERHSIIRGSLNNLHFTSDAAAQTAFTIVEPHIKRMDDGALIGAIPNGDNFPVDAFVKDYLTKEHSYLLRASGASGSGAPANSSGVRMGVKADLGDIKTGMKPETRESVVASIAAALQNV